MVRKILLSKELQHEIAILGNYPYSGINEYKRKLLQLIQKDRIEGVKKTGIKAKITAQITDNIVANYLLEEKINHLINNKIITRANSWQEFEKYIKDISDNGFDAQYLIGFKNKYIINQHTINKIQNSDEYKALWMIETILNDNKKKKYISKKMLDNFKEEQVSYQPKYIYVINEEKFTETKEGVFRYIYAIDENEELLENENGPIRYKYFQESGKVEEDKNLNNNLKLDRNNKHLKKQLREVYIIENNNIKLDKKGRAIRLDYKGEKIYRYENLNNEDIKLKIQSIVDKVERVNIFQKGSIFKHEIGRIIKTLLINQKSEEYLSDIIKDNNISLKLFFNILDIEFETNNNNLEYVKKSLENINDELEERLFHETINNALFINKNLKKDLDIIIKREYDDYLVLQKNVLKIIDRYLKNGFKDEAAENLYYNISNISIDNYSVVNQRSLINQFVDKIKQNKINFKDHNLNLFIDGLEEEASEYKEMNIYADHVISQLKIKLKKYPYIKDFLKNIEEFSKELYVNEKQKNKLQYNQITISKIKQIYQDSIEKGFPLRRGSIVGDRHNQIQDIEAEIAGKSFEKDEIEKKNINIGLFDALKMLCQYEEMIEENLKTPKISGDVKFQIDKIIKKIKEVESNNNGSNLQNTKLAILDILPKNIKLYKDIENIDVSKKQDQYSYFNSIVNMIDDCLVNLKKEIQELEKELNYKRENVEKKEEKKENNTGKSVKFASEDQLTQIIPRGNYADEIAETKEELVR